MITLINSINICCYSTLLTRKGVFIDSIVWNPYTGGFFMTLENHHIFGTEFERDISHECVTTIYNI